MSDDFESSKTIYLLATVSLTSLCFSACPSPREAVSRQSNGVCGVQSCVLHLDVHSFWRFPDGSVVKNAPAVQEMPI